MGCGSSKIINAYSHHEHLSEHREIFQALSFKEIDIGRLYRVYRKIDVDGGGDIELAELLAYLDLDKTRFTKRIFSLFDEDKSGRIDFKEFVLSLWNYCTLTKASLVLFAFDLYDKDASGNITNNEVLDMLSDLYGPRFRSNPQARLIAAELDALEALDGDISIEDFREFSRTHPALLFLAYQMQESIQKNVLGKNFWNMYCERRIELSKGKVYISIQEFLEIHVNSHLHDAILNNRLVAPTNGGRGGARRESTKYANVDHPSNRRDNQAQDVRTMTKEEIKSYNKDLAISQHTLEVLNKTGSMSRRGSVARGSAKQGIISSKGLSTHSSKRYHPPIGNSLNADVYDKYYNEESKKDRYVHEGLTYHQRKLGLGKRSSKSISRGQRRTFDQVEEYEEYSKDFHTPGEGHDEVSQAMKVLDQQRKNQLKVSKKEGKQKNNVDNSDDEDDYGDISNKGKDRLRRRRSSLALESHEKLLESMKKRGVDVGHMAEGPNFASKKKTFVHAIDRKTDAEMGLEGGDDDPTLIAGAKYTMKTTHAGEFLKKSRTKRRTFGF